MRGMWSLSAAGREGQPAPSPYTGWPEKWDGRAAERNDWDPHLRFWNLGFRLARSVP